MWDDGNSPTRHSLPEPRGLPFLPRLVRLGLERTKVSKTRYVELTFCVLLKSAAGYLGQQEWMGCLDARPLGRGRGIVGKTTRTHAMRDWTPRVIAAVRSRMRKPDWPGSRGAGARCTTGTCSSSGSSAAWGVTLQLGDTVQNLLHPGAGRCLASLRRWPAHGRGLKAARARGHRGGRKFALSKAHVWLVPDDAVVFGVGPCRRNLGRFVNRRYC